jgi:HK97 family phage portal protein
MKWPALFRRKGAVTPMTVADNPSLSGVGYGGGWYNLLREPFAGAFQANITVDRAADLLAFSGIFAPLTLMAGDISKLGICLVAEDANGIEQEVDTSPYNAVLRRPNHFQNRIQFVEQWILSKGLYGNTYALKDRDARGIVQKLYILDAQRVTPTVSPTGDVFYRLAANHLAGLTEAVIVPAREIIHDRWNCLFHALVGIPPIYACGMSATMGRRIQSNSGTFFQNMSRPSGILTSPIVIKDEDAAMMKKRWEENYGGINQGRIAVLGGGLSYQGMTIPAEQAQLIQQLEWSIRDIASCFHVPLFKVGGPIPVGSTVEALQLQYFTDCLQTLIEAFELCLDEGLSLPNGYCTEFDIENLARMDTPSQITTLSESVRGGWLAPNEARKKRNLAPLKGGDSAYLQQQNFSLEALAKRDALPNPFVIDRPTTNPTPSGEGPPVVADPNAGKVADPQVLKMLPAYAGAKLAEIIARKAACISN